MRASGKAKFYWNNTESTGTQRAVGYLQFVPYKTAILKNQGAYKMYLLHVMSLNCRPELLKSIITIELNGRILTCGMCGLSCREQI